MEKFSKLGAVPTYTKQSYFAVKVGNWQTLHMSPKA